jgi:prophage regulatory protein
MTDTVLRFPRVRERVGGLSKSWIYQEITEGRFPMPIKLGGRAVGWLESEVTAWLISRVEQSRGKKVESLNVSDPPTAEPSRIGRFGGTALGLRPGLALGRSPNS